MGRSMHRGSERQKETSLCTVLWFVYDGIANFERGERHPQRAPFSMHTNSSSTAARTGAGASEASRQWRTGRLARAVLLGAAPSALRHPRSMPCTRTARLGEGGERRRNGHAMAGGKRKRKRKKRAKRRKSGREGGERGRTNQPLRFLFRHRHLPAVLIDVAVGSMQAKTRVKRRQRERKRKRNDG